MLTPLLSPLFDAIPPELRDMPQSVCWRLENRPGEDKPTKVPYNPHTSGKAMADQPGTWADFDTARGVYERSQKTNRPYSGIGFQLGTAGGPFFAVDLDKCIDPDTGEVAEWAQEIVEALPTYWERSPSGTGLRAIGRGTLPEGGRNRKGPIEFYDRLRYITLTGHVFGERVPIADCTGVLPGLHARLFPPAPKPASAPRPIAPLSLSDADLIDKATAAANGTAFSALWRGDTSAYHGDDSAADLALCGTLAFWAQGDEHRIDALFRQSGLYREKWERADYRARTIGKALSGKTDFYEPAAPRELGRQGYGTPLPPPVRPAAGTASLPPSVTAAPVQEWPTPAPEALHGLPGDFVRAIEPHTEADPMALLVQFLVSFGSCMGRGPHYLAEGDKHGGNLFAVLVGVSSKGRKGTSQGRVRPLFESVAPAWADKRVLSGLSSGEGLIHAVRDPLEREEKNKKTGEMETVLVDAGVEDKRLLVLESEFASVLRQTQRDGNTLSATVRNAWDTGTLRSMTKNSPAQATGAHISIVGHITAQELKKDLAETEYANGFGNRFLWVCVKRSKELPFGGDMGNVSTAPLVARLRAALEHAEGTGRMLFDDGARGLWADVYHDLSSGKPGLLGSMTSRSEAQVCRLALLYALLDLDTAIRLDHLTAALALWEYCEASARFIFGDSLGDRVADDILRALRETSDGMSRNALREMFGRNQSSTRIGEALTVLAGQGLALMERQAAEGPGRPMEVWKAAN